jgi:hypothetical protein
VCLDPKHAEADPEHPKRIKRRRRPRKTLLDEGDRRSRMLYTRVLEEAVGITTEQAEPQNCLIEEKVIIIGVDEYMIGFGGSSNELISAMEGEETYENVQNVLPTRFKLMQWDTAAAVLFNRAHPYPQIV